MKYSSVIFDLDGTLLESSSYDLSWLHKAVQDALISHGCEEDLSVSELETLAGLNSKKDLVNKCESIGVEPESFWKSVTEKRANNKLNFIENGGISLCSGAIDLLNYLNNQGMYAALVSNSPNVSVDAVVDHFNLDQYLYYYGGVTTLDDLGSKKPDPTHIEPALHEFEQDSCVYVGDSDSDVKAAENAGIDSIKIDKNSDLSKLKEKIN